MTWVYDYGPILRQFHEQVCIADIFQPQRKSRVLSHPMYAPQKLEAQPHQCQLFQPRLSSDQQSLHLQHVERSYHELSHDYVHGNCGRSLMCHTHLLLEKKEISEECLAILEQQASQIENIQQSKAARIQHIQHTMFQSAFIQGQIVKVHSSGDRFYSHLCLFPILQTENGPIQKSRKPLWTTFPDAKDVGRELILDGCKTGCKGICKCRKAALI